MTSDSPTGGEPGPSAPRSGASGAPPAQHAFKEGDWIGVCPACGNPIRLGADDRGRVITCPACSHEHEARARAEAMVQPRERGGRRVGWKARFRQRGRRSAAPPLQGEGVFAPSESAQPIRVRPPAAAPAPVPPMPEVIGASPVTRSWQPKPVEERNEVPKEIEEVVRERLRPKEEEEAPEGKQRKRRSKKKLRFGAKQELVDWDQDEAAQRGMRPGLRFMLVAGILLTAAIVTLVVIITHSGSRTGGWAGFGGSAQPSSGFEPRPEVLRGEEGLRWLVLYRPEEASAMIRPVVRDFLEAEDWRDRLAHVRDPDRVAPLMEEHYATHSDGPVAYRRVAPEAAVAYRGSLAVVSVLLDDFSMKQVAVDFAEADLRIDWESFVGYGEMDPGELREKTPTEPVLMRGSLRMADPPYFNYAFTDEEKLDCYLLTFPDDSYMFAYAERFGPVATRVREWLAVDGSTMATLKLAYPEEDRASNQVRIVEAVEEGWVLGLDEPVEMKEKADDPGAPPSLTPGL